MGHQRSPSPPLHGSKRYPDYHVEPTRPTDLAWRGDTPAGAPGGWHPRMPERLDEEELADWRTGRDAGLSARRAGGSAR
jgi:hypothetical protein